MEVNGFEKSSENDDPVEREIPIYIAKRLQENLYVFQYPLEPKFMDMSKDIKRVFVKPNSMEVKLEMDINSESPSFDPVKAKDIAADVDGMSDKREDANIVFENGMVDKIDLYSKKVVSNSKKYAIGYYNGRELHFTSLKGILQLKPPLDYLNKSSQKKKKEKQLTESNEDEEEGESSLQQVTVKFAKPTLNSAKVKPHNQDDMKVTEAWIECDFHGKGSILSEVQEQKLLTETTEVTGQAMNVTPDDYVRMLVPEDKEKKIVLPNLPLNVMSLHALKALPLIDRCKTLLMSAQIIHFHQLQLLLAGGDGVTTENLLRSVSQIAVVVRGNWIIKSDILYPNNTYSSISGVPADIMCRARDFILLLFTKNQYVDRRKVSAAIRIPAEELKNIFTGISKLQHNKGWTLSLPDDTNFISKHFDIVERQNAAWEQRAKQLEEYLKDDNKEKVTRKRKMSKSVSEDVPVRTVLNKRTKKDSISSDTDSGTEKGKTLSKKRLKLNGNMLNGVLT